MPRVMISDRIIGHAPKIADIEVIHAFDRDHW